MFFAVAGAVGFEKVTGLEDNDEQRSNCYGFVAELFFRKCVGFAAKT